MAIINKILKMIALLSFLATIGFFVSKTGNKCDYAGYSKKRVKVGGHTFLVSKTSIQLMSSEKGLVLYKDIACLQNDDPPFELTHLSLTPNLPGYVDGGLRNYEPFLARIRFTPLDRRKRNKDFYNIVSDKEWLSKGADLSKYPVEDGFYIIKHRSKSYLLIPVDKSFTTPSNNRVVFECGHKNGSENLPIHCVTGLVWKDGLYLEIDRISDAWVPKKTLQNFYNLVLEHADTL